MGGFSNPFRSPSAPDSRDRRRRNPRFAPEALEQRLSLSGFGSSSDPAVAITVYQIPSTPPPPYVGAINYEIPSTPPPPDGDGSPPDTGPVIPIGPSGPA